MKKKLYLGVGRACITPAIGALLMGYGPDTVSDAVHDDLNVTAFYFEQGEARALVVSIDLCLIHTSLCDEMRARIAEEYGIPYGNILLSCTHTHSGPNLCGMTGWGDVDEGYYRDVFLPALLSAVASAKEKTTSVKMGVASGESYIGINRRQLNADNKIYFGQNPWGPFNPVMTVIAFRDEAGAPVANMVHYGMHGTCAGKNFEISRDWCGVMVDELEAISGGITAFFNGPEGDVGPRLTNGLTVGRGDIRYAERHGALAAADAVRIFKSIKSFDEVALSVLDAHVVLPLVGRVPLALAEREYEMYKNNTVGYRHLKEQYYEEQIRLYREGYIDKETVSVPQTIVKLGEVAFVSTPFELFSVIGMRIAAESRIQHTLTLSCTNGAENYFVTEDQICRGGYEVEMFKCGHTQPFADDADWHFVTGTVENLKKFKD